MQLRVVALDDETHALERFEEVVKDFEEITLCGLFHDDEELLAFIEKNPMDIVFLDIEMPGKSGMQLSEEIHGMHPETAVVFVTAYNQYAVEAFELSVTDYLIKPLSRERLEKTLTRIQNSRRNTGITEKKVSIHCFQRFECKVNDEVIPLNHLMKSKELLAFLVSRKGAATSWEQITEALWPDMDFEKAHNNFYITTYRLRKWLSENNITQIFECRRNSYRVVPSEFQCDLYDLEKLKKDGSKIPAEYFYRGDFLEEEGYEWAYPIQAEWMGEIKY